MVRENSVRMSPKCHPSRRMWARGLCNSCYKNEWRRENPGRDVQSASKRLDNDPETKRRSHLLRKFNLTVEDYQDMYNQQHGLCAICKEPSQEVSLCVDHNHKTGAIRGLLCTTCNKGLGHFSDDTDLLENAVSYLRDHS